jgi:hypothetical protein
MIRISVNFRISANANVMIRLSLCYDCIRLWMLVFDFMIRLSLCYDCLRLWMFVFDYMIMLYDFIIWFIYVTWLATRCLSRSINSRLKRLNSRLLNSSRVTNRMKRLSSRLRTYLKPSTAAESSHSWGGCIGWITFRTCLSSMKEKVTDVVADRRYECWWG